MIVGFWNLLQLKASFNKQLYTYTSKIVQVSIVLFAMQMWN